jgi:ATP-dependent Clp protease protease subunit
MDNAIPMMMQDSSEGPIWVTEFDAKAASEFCNALFKASEADPQKPIIVYINSYGGEASGLLAMLSAMDAVPNTIVTVAMGFAMSAGCILLAHGDARFASPYARIMMHKIQAGAGGGMDDILNEVEELVSLNDQIFEIMSKDLERPVADLMEAVKSRRELYMSAETAKQFGIVDEIGVPTLQNQLPTTPQYNVSVLVGKGGSPPDVPKPESVKKKKKAKKNGIKNKN